MACLSATGNRLTIGMDDKGQFVDRVIQPDFSKSIPSGRSTLQCLKNLSTVDVSNLGDLLESLGTGYEYVQLMNTNINPGLSEGLPVIVSCARNKDNRDIIDLEFERVGDTKLFVELMVQSSILDDSYHVDDISSKLLTIPKEAFDKIQGYANYKIVQIPKKHSEEDSLVDENGEITQLKLIQNAEALVKNMDPNKEDSIQFNFGQLEDPIQNRLPARLFMGHPVSRMAYNKHILMDITKKELTETVKEFSFELDEDIKSFRRHSEESEEYFRKWQEANIKNPKKFLLFKYLDPTTKELQWVCYGKDATGRYKDVVMQYTKNDKKIKLEKDAIVNGTDVLERMVIYYGYYKKLERGVRDYHPLEKQIPMDEKGITLRETREDYHIDDNRGLPVVEYSDVAKPSNTIYTKKTSTTLLRPDGKTKLFNPDIWTEFIPVGLIYDVNKVHRHGDRYIWETDAYTADKFWLGDVSESVLRDPQKHHIGRNVNLQELQNHLQELANSDTPPTEWNELMVGLTKTALKGLFVQSDDITSRISMLKLYLRTKQEFSIDVPLFVIDGERPPRRYTETDLRQDLEILFKAVESNDLGNLTISGKDASLQQEIFKQFLNEIDYNQLKSQHGDNIDKVIAVVMEDIDMIGGLKREQAYLDRKWDPKSSTVQAKCLKRAKALEHWSIVNEIYKRQGKDPIVENLKDILSDNDLRGRINKILSDNIELATELVAKVEKLDLDRFETDQKKLKYRSIESILEILGKIEADLSLKGITPDEGAKQVILDSIKREFPLIKKYEDLLEDYELMSSISELQYLSGKPQSDESGDEVESPKPEGRVEPVRFVNTIKPDKSDNPLEKLETPTTTNDEVPKTRIVKRRDNK